MIGKHEYTATLAVPEGYVEVPGYDVEHDAVTLFTDGFENGSDNWTPTFATETYVADVQPHSGAQCLLIESSESTNAASITRVLADLTVGRQYTVTAWARELFGTPAIIVVGTEPGTQNGSTDSGWQQITYTFTAAATSHLLALSYSVAGSTAQGDWGFWDDITVTQDAWTEHVPDQIAYTYELHINDGAVSLDEGWSPYVQCDVTVTTPPPDMLDRLDPRNSPRVTVGATAYTVAPGQTVETSTRTLDLLLRARTIDHNAGTTALTLAGDDATLQDYKLIGDEPDASSLGYQDSVRAIVNGVLGRAGLPTLQPGDADADFTTLDARTNQMTNPSAQIDLTDAVGNIATLRRQTSITADWATHGTAFRLDGSTAGSGSNLTIGGDNGALRLGMQAGKTYTCSATYYSDVVLTGTENAISRQIAVGVAQSGGAAFYLATSPKAPNAAGASRRLSVTFTLPDDATSAYIRFAHGHQSNTACYWTDILLTEGDGTETDGVLPLAFFDGGTPDTALYNYTWSAAVGKSTSTRTPVFDRSPDTLLWQPGESGWDFLQPILTQSGLRLFCDESRDFYLVDNTYSVPGLVTVQTGDNLYTAQDTVDRTATAPDGSPLWFDAVVIKYTWNDSNNQQQIRYDTASVDSPTQPALIEYARPYPGPGAAAYILSRVNGQGRKLDLTARMDFAVTPGMAFSATLPVTETQTGYVSSVKWSIGSDDMTVGTRGLIDTPADAWLLTPDALTWDGVDDSVTWDTYENEGA